MRSELAELGRRPDDCLPLNRHDVIHTLTRLIDDEVDDDVILHLAGVWQLNYEGNGPNLVS